MDGRRRREFLTFVLLFYKNYITITPMLHPLYPYPSYHRF